MIKTYRKTATIQAEQYDGSDEMREKYQILGSKVDVISPLKTIKGYVGINVGDWIATGTYGEHWAIKDDIFKRTYEEVTNDEA